MKTKQNVQNDEITTTVSIANMEISEIELNDMKHVTASLKSIVRLIRFALGHEPKGAHLAVAGKFVGDKIVWAVSYTYVASNAGHVEYLRNIGPVLPLPIVERVAA